MSITALPRDVIELDRSPLFQNAQQLLRRAEAEISLIDRVQPRNAASEREALITAWGQGRPRAPRFEYRAPPVLTELRAELAATATRLDGYGMLGLEYAERARELEAEALIAEHTDTPAFRDHAARRFPIEHSAHALAADTWAEHWIHAADDTDSRVHRSDDRGDPESLVRQLERATEGLPVRIEIRPNQAAAAAVGDGFVGVRPGLWHSRRMVLRIVLHEIEAHARPRVQAHREELALFRIGSARSSEDEEGRALLIERRAGVFDGARRRELARRHIAARAVRSGANFVDTVLLLIANAQDTANSIETACRAHRGGGLAREYVYLVALARVSAAFETDPTLESFLERGRLSIAAARACASGFAP
jgi:hypothetical protein